jgi:hypothetical protein
VSRLTQLFSVGPQSKVYTDNSSLTTSDVGKTTSIIAASDITLNLPDATLLQIGTDTFSLVNSSQFNIKINDNSGRLLVILFAYGSADLHLVDNNTAAGTWVCGNLKKTNDMINISIGTANALPNTVASGTVYKIIGYDSSTIVVFYTNASNIFSAVAGSISGETITWGTPITIFNGTISGEVNADIMTGSIVFGYNNSTQGKVVLSYITVSGTTLVKGADSVPAFTTTGYDLCTLNIATGRGVIVYWTGTNANIVAAVFTFNGSSISFGTASNIIDNNAIRNQPSAIRVVGVTSTIAYATAGANFNSAGDNYGVGLYAINTSGTSVTSITGGTITNAFTSSQFTGARPFLYSKDNILSVIYKSSSTGIARVRRYVFDPSTGNTLQFFQYGFSYTDDDRLSSSINNQSIYPIYDTFYVAPTTESTGTYIKFYKINQGAVRFSTVYSAPNMVTSTPPALIGSYLWAQLPTRSISRINPNIPFFAP